MLSTSFSTIYNFNPEAARCKVLRAYCDRGVFPVSELLRLPSGLDSALWVMIHACGRPGHVLTRSFLAACCEFILPHYEEFWPGDFRARRAVRSVRQGRLADSTYLHLAAADRESTASARRYVTDADVKSRADSAHYAVRAIHQSFKSVYALREIQIYTSRNCLKAAPPCHNELKSKIRSRRIMAHRWSLDALGFFDRAAPHDDGAWQIALLYFLLDG